jgi:hypothetical protein
MSADSRQNGGRGSAHDQCPIRSIIDKRSPKNRTDFDRALREVNQETALAGLWRTGFFEPFPHPVRVVAPACLFAG